MKIDIYRKVLSDRSWTGVLMVDGQQETTTLEPHPTNPVHEGHPCIPAGKYKVALTPSPHLGYVTPEILNVPGRTAIRIHIANFPKDLLGCTAVGMTVGPDFVGESKEAFNDRLMPLLKFAADHGQDITAEWHDPQ